ncbi:MAG TPA: YkvA family protein [Ignavibacteria bacterium]|nr:YkvA family protein [Ignavibacteria bacterium]HMR40313.1 YkvA family protein [Ignavibacteria bacterium]
MSTNNTKKGSKSDVKYVNDNINKKLNDSSVKDLWFIGDVVKLFNMMTDSKVGWDFKCLAVGALAYFICPIDAIPDLIPVAGFLDDAGVITATITYLKSKMDDYN